MSHKNGSVTAVTHASCATVLSRDCLPPCTVRFHSICQSHITGPQKSTKCHDGHVDCPKSGPGPPGPDTKGPGPGPES